MDWLPLNESNTHTFLSRISYPIYTTHTSSACGHHRSPLARHTHEASSPSKISALVWRYSRVPEATYTNQTHQHYGVPAFPSIYSESDSMSRPSTHVAANYDEWMDGWRSELGHVILLWIFYPIYASPICTFDVCTCWGVFLHLFKTLP